MGARLALKSQRHSLLANGAGVPSRPCLSLVCSCIPRLKIASGVSRLPGGLASRIESPQPPARLGRFAAPSRRARGRTPMTSTAGGPPRPAAARVWHGASLAESRTPQDSTTTATATRTRGPDGGSSRTEDRTVVTAGSPGRLTSRVDGLGTTSYGYDARNQRQTVTAPGTSVTTLTNGHHPLRRGPHEQDHHSWLRRGRAPYPNQESWSAASPDARNCLDGRSDCVKMPLRALYDHHERPYSQATSRD